MAGVSVVRWAPRGAGLFRCGGHDAGLAHAMLLRNATCSAMALCNGGAVLRGLSADSACGSVRGSRAAAARHHSTVRIRNTLDRDGSPAELPVSDDGCLTWYACGPTVYDDAHIGHARTYVCQVRPPVALVQWLLCSPAHRSVCH